MARLNLGANVTSRDAMFYNQLTRHTENINGIMKDRSPGRGINPKGCINICSRARLYIFHLHWKHALNTQPHERHLLGINNMNPDHMYHRTSTLNNAKNHKQCRQIPWVLSHLITIH